jgi:hypothetical protein
MKPKQYIEPGICPKCGRLMETDEVLYTCPQCNEKGCVVCLPDQGEAPCRNCEPTDPGIDAESIDAESVGAGLGGVDDEDLDEVDGEDDHYDDDRNLDD